ncbi:MAG: hypothetical protein HQ582_31620, partial [Planctomycetes bacterium]|nr:hypothetical protein [Planctomycetota bacterium]
MNRILAALDFVPTEPKGQSLDTVRPVIGPESVFGGIKIQLAGDVRIDNRDELINRLSSHQGGLPPCTTDSEVIAASFAAWGA